MITPEMAQRALELRGISPNNSQTSDITPEMARRALELRGAMPQEDLGAQLHSKYPAQNIDPTIAMRQKIEGGIESLPPVLRGLYGANYQIANDPGRAAKVAASGTLSSIGNLSQGKPLIDIWPKEEKINYEKKANDLLGIKDKRRGDSVLGGLPLALIPELKAREGAGLVEYLATKGAEGTIYGQTANNPGAGAAIGIGVGAIPAAYTGIKNAGSSIKNKILDYISKESGKGRAFTPKETQENLQRNFTDVEGNRLKPDLGTATNNSAASNVYNVTSRVPLSGGKDQRSLLKKSLREVEERDFMKQNTEKQEALDADLNQAKKIAPVLADENVSLNEAANRAIAKSQSIDNEIIPNLEKQYASANDFLDALAPEGSIAASKNIKNQLKESFAKDKAVDKENYRAVNEFDKEVPGFSDPGAFENYRASYNRFSPQSQSLKEIFGDNTDLGSGLSKEMKKAEAFLSGEGGSLGDLDKALGGSDILERVSPDAREQIISQLKDTAKTESQEGTLGAILSHARSLQKLGSAAKSAGRRAEGTALFDMAASLKKDIKKILRDSGNAKVADQLEAADKYHQDTILPYYEKPEIRSTVLYDRHSADTLKLSQELHDENQFGILGRLSPEAQKATLNRLLAKSGGSSKGKANFDTAKTRLAYEKLDAETKARIEQYHPGTEQYFDYLKETKSAIKSSKELSKHQLAVANTAFAKIKKNEDITARMQKINDEIQKNAFEKQKFLSKKFKAPLKGMAEPGGLVGKEALSSLKKSGVTVLELALLGLLPKTVGAAAIPTVLLSRKANKLLTDPELLEKYLSGQRYPKLKIAPSKSSGALIRALRIANQPNQEGAQ